jgi:hypothetical protein
MESLFYTHTQKQRNGSKKLIENNSTKYFIFLSFLFLLFILLFGFYYTQLDGYYINKPVTFSYWDKENTVTHKTVKTIYFPGDTVAAKIEAHKDKVWPAKKITWSLVNDETDCYPSKEGVLEKGFNKKTVVIAKLKDDVKSGWHHFSGAAVFDVNFSNRDIVIPLKTNDFLILPKPEK